jgi:hypothetical protein
MPYLGIGSISGIVHMTARFPHAARVALLIAIWRQKMRLWTTHCCLTFRNQVLVHDANFSMLAP